MEESEPRRRLAAILAADVAGYTRLVEQDTAGTVAAWKAARDEVVQPVLSERGGRIVKFTGDGFLAEFTSVEDAVLTAVECQERLAGDTLRFRMGIHLGDVVDDGKDIHGEGVNIAARIEAIAEPGGICVSAAVHEQVRNRLSHKFEDLGEHEVKHVSAAVRVYQIAGRASAEPTEIPDRPSPVGKPTLAVLPFESFSNDKDQEFFGDGLAEDVITTLAKVSSLLIIARHSSFRYKGTATDVRQIAADLGARYILEGSVRSAGERIRVTAQLIDSQDGRHIWAERYDRKLDDIFVIQDEITREIVTALRIQLTDGEQAQLRLQGTNSVEAWSFAFGSYDKVMSPVPEHLAEARQLLNRAVAVDPAFAAAHALIGFTHNLEIHFGFTADRKRSLELLQKATERALSLDPELPLGQCLAALAAAYAGDYQEAVRLGRRAVQSSPNDVVIKLAFGRILINAGNFAEAEDQVRAAMRINPFYPIFYFGILANALERQGRDDEAISLLRTAVARDKDYFPGHLRLASLLGLRGNLLEGRHHAEEALRINPRVDSAFLKGFYPTSDPAALARFVSGLASSGVHIEP